MQHHLEDLNPKRYIVSAAKARLNISCQREDWRRNVNSLIEGGSCSTCGFDSFWYSLRRKQVACLFFKSTSGVQVLCGHTLPAVKGAASLSLQRMMPLQEDPSSFFIQGHIQGRKDTNDQMQSPMMLRCQRKSLYHRLPSKPEDGPVC